MHSYAYSARWEQADLLDSYQQLGTVLEFIPSTSFQQLRLQVVGSLPIIDNHDEILN